MAKILIIDDDPDIVASMKVILEKEKYRIVSAGGQEEGLIKARSEKPDLIILDVMMAEGTEGFDVARTLKKEEAFKKVPILMLTAIKEKTGMGFEKEAGDETWLPVDDYCEKPLKPKIVLFEELLDPTILSASMKLARKSNLIIGVGTSLGIFPAADILLAPSPNKIKKALFNLTPTDYDRLLHYIILGDVVDTLPVLVKEVEKILSSEENNRY